VGAAVDREDVSAGAVSGAAVDWALYGSFWGVQKYMADPRLAESASGWEEFCTHMGTVLSAFEVTPVLAEPSPPGPEARWPKFLTNPALLRLQLSDIFLRRIILTQCCIALQHLLFHAMELREGKPEEFKFWRPIFRSLGDDGSAAGAGDILNDRALALLDVVDEADGVGLSLFLQGALQREEIWIKWKNGGCRSSNPAEDIRNQLLGSPVKLGKRPRPTPRSQASIGPTVRAPADEDPTATGYLSRKRKSWDLAGSEPSRKSVTLSAEELAVEWAPLTYEGRKRALLDERNMAILPTIEEYKSQLTQDEEDGIEEEYRKASDASYTWRCMRALSVQNCDAFIQIADPESTKPFPAFDLRRLLDIEGDVHRTNVKKFKLNPGAKDFEPI
jgi:hypothetical protein